MRNLCGIIIEGKNKSKVKSRNEQRYCNVFYKNKYLYQLNWVNLNINLQYVETYKLNT